jgi:ATP-binding cassette subfamily G (WHITE) protein 2 (PDR)
MVTSATGIDSKSIRTEFRGQCTYQADTDVHFPNLTLDQTLAVADKASGRNRSVNLHPADQSNVLEDISGYDAILSSLGLSDQQNTKVGGDFVTGLSGGERKRTSIAEVIINGSTIQLWDNSTRGLDSANALRFVRILRALASKAHSTIIVSLYQASEEIFNVSSDDSMSRRRDN